LLVKAAERAEVTVESLIGELDKRCPSPSCGESKRAVYTQRCVNRLSNQHQKSSFF
jgi:hypothetical protein